MNSFLRRLGKFGYNLGTPVKKQSMFKGWTIPNSNLIEENIPSRTVLLYEFNREFASYYGKKPTTDEELGDIKKSIINQFGNFDIDRLIKKLK